MDQRSCDLVVLVEIVQEFTIIWDKYQGWQNGFEHFNDSNDEEGEIDEIMSAADDSI